ncbi:hypothetical protein B0H66DRAFT_594247 [Apodospora peruviana]|uniref:Uncharacterized protein n=1 Tax=Apodospora peruviana TaxID=516989 RepID=A0AAE0HUX7_9PEZI|nr:hypothetical protein B0H66DRAFT_594247 [Apodospora peruviana]
MDLLVHDPTSIQCLRRTSRIFLRLFSSRTHALSLGPPRSRIETPRDRIVAIRTHRVPPEASRHAKERAISLTPNLRQPLRALLEQDASQRLCFDCCDQATRWLWHDDKRERHKKLTTTFKFCSRCGVRYRLAYFPRAQRSLGVDTIVCIGHEGAVRLCEHKAVRWETVVNAAFRLRSSHGDDDSQQQRRRTMLLLDRCNHPSHFPTHHHHSNSSPGGKKMKAKKNLERVRPSAYMVAQRGKEAGMYTAVRVVLRWGAHLLVPDDDDDRDKGVTPAEMTSLLK